MANDKPETEASDTETPSTSPGAGSAAASTSGAGGKRADTSSRKASRRGRSGNPAKAAAAEKLRTKRVDPFRDPAAGPVISARFVLALALIVVGIAWIVYYYVGVRPTDGIYGAVDAKGHTIEPGGPGFMGDIQRWNYVIGFGLFFLGLIVSAHPKTPLGRGRGVVVGMLGCFLIGLAWICVFYAIANSSDPKIPVFNDLDQKNLIVGIVFMAVGFTFATRWE